MIHFYPILSKRIKVLLYIYCNFLKITGVSTEFIDFISISSSIFEWILYSLKSLIFLFEKDITSVE